jgi:nucleoside-diphosphate kinase
MADLEREFVMIKPDGVNRRLVGIIINRFECLGLRLVAMKMLHLTKDLAEKHYAIHKGKPFFEGLISYIISGPVVAMIFEGDQAVKRIRQMVGATNPFDAAPGTIRGDYALEIGRNVVHAADSPENAKIEYSLYFKEEEILSYTLPDETWLYE